MEKPKSGEQKTRTDLDSQILYKILELQGSSLSAKEQISTLINFVQSNLEIETIAVYTNFAKEQINLISSKAGAKQHSKLGFMLESISEQIDTNQTRYYNSLIPLSELNIQNLSQEDLNTFVYPILSPHAKQIYGIVLITYSKLITDLNLKKILLFTLNYITKLIEEADLANQVIGKGEKLELLSKLSNSLRGVLKAEKAIDIVLKGIFGFLNLEDIYFAQWHPKEKRLEVTREIVSDKSHSLIGFLHRASSKNPIIRLLYKNQYMTYKNKNIRKISRVFLGKKQPSIFCMIPVIIRNELLGTIICVNTKSANEAPTEDLRITLDVAGQLAVILNQSTLYEESLSTAQ